MDSSPQGLKQVFYLKNKGIGGQRKVLNILSKNTTFFLKCLMPEFYLGLSLFVFMYFVMFS